MARYINGDKLVLMLSAWADKIDQDVEALEASKYVAYDPQCLHETKLFSKYTRQLMQVIEETLESECKNEQL